MAKQKRGFGGAAAPTDPGAPTASTRRPRRGGGVAAALHDAPGGGIELEVPLDEIADHPLNEAERLDEAAVADLLASVRAVGVIEPAVLVTTERLLEAHPQWSEQVGSARYVSLTGHRRRHASRLCGLKVIPAVVRDDLLKAGGDVIALHENSAEARLGLTPLQEAQRFARLMQERGLSQRQLAEHLGRPQGQISKRLALLELSETIQGELAQGRLTLAQGVELSSTLRAAGEDRTGLAAQIDDLLTAGREQGNDRHAVDLLVSRARAEVARQRNRQQAEQAAEREQVPLVESVPSSQWLMSDAAVEQARASGDLAVTPGWDVPQYVRLTPPLPDEAQHRDHLEARDRKQARAAREAFLAEQLPFAGATRLRRDDLAWLLTLAATTGQGLGADVTRLARKLCQGADLGPDLQNADSDWPWRDHVAALDPASDTAQHIAAVVALAGLECLTHAPHQRWGRTQARYLGWLTGRGYQPTAWESARLAALDQQGDSAESPTTDEEGQA